MRKFCYIMTAYSSDQKIDRKFLWKTLLQSVKLQTSYYKITESHK